MNINILRTFPKTPFERWLPLFLLDNIDWFAENKREQSALIKKYVGSKYDTMSDDIISQTLDDSDNNRGKLQSRYKSSPVCVQ